MIGGFATGRPTYPEQMESRREALKVLLGRELHHGHELLSSNADLETALQWGQQRVTGLIANSLGEGEAHVFGTDPTGIEPEPAGPNQKARHYLRCRIHRLDELIGRLNELPIRDDFKGIDDGLDSDSGQPGPTEPPSEPQPARPRRRRASWYKRHRTDILVVVAILSFLAVVAGIVVPLVVLDSRGASGPTTSAQAGKVSAQLGRRPTGQIQSAARVADVTRGRWFSDHLHAAPCDVLLYRIMVYNPGVADLHHVRVAASINTITPYSEIIPTVVVYAPGGDPSQRAIQPRIYLPRARTQSYVTGSTEMLNSGGHVVLRSARRQVPDEITATGNGIDIGSVDVGITEFVQFRTKLSCAPPSIQ